MSFNLIGCKQAFRVLIRYEVCFYVYEINFNCIVFWFQFSTVIVFSFKKNVLVPRSSHIKDLHYIIQRQKSVAWGTQALLGSVHTWCPVMVPGYDSKLSTNVNTPFSKYPMPKFGLGARARGLYSGTKLSTGSLCEHNLHWLPSTFPTISQKWACARFFEYEHVNFQIGYHVSEHSTILCWYPGTSAKCPGTKCEHCVRTQSCSLATLDIGTPVI